MTSLLQTGLNGHLPAPPEKRFLINPYCGYVDTHRFSETPIPGFIKVGQLPPHQETGLHMLDSIDYAANAGMVPEIAAIGDNDTFFQSHVYMREVFAREGIPFVNLISPGASHKIDPVTHADQMRRIGESPTTRSFLAKPATLGSVVALAARFCSPVNAQASRVQLMTRSPRLSSASAAPTSLKPMCVTSTSFCLAIPAATHGLPKLCRINL